jgi:hypothetical protein
LGSFLFWGNSLSHVSARLRGWSLRQFIFAIIVIGIVGLLAELLLIDHMETRIQWIPIVVLLAGLASCIWIAARPGKAAFRTFQAIMAIFIVAGVAGLYFHYAGNVEFAIERDATLSGLKLAWKSLRGATPALAPGALAQLGLLGLAYTYTHPAMRRTANGES